MEVFLVRLRRQDPYTSQDVGNVSASGYLTLNPDNVISLRIIHPLVQI